MHVTQEITHVDKENRLKFARWLLENMHLIQNIVWSDEAYFSLDGTINRHNCAVWSMVNPHMRITKSLHSPKLCVWIGFSANLILTPFFFDGTITGESYLKMLTEHVVPQLKQNLDMKSCIFQQDGAPPHFSMKVREFLQKTFTEERLICRGFSKPWPARSPDLTPLDFWFWGLIKARVYHVNKPATLAELKERITQECARVTCEEICTTLSHLTYRLQRVNEEEGGLIEHLL